MHGRAFVCTLNGTKYIGLDVQATISAAALDSTGKLVMESILETKAATIPQFVHGLRGSLHVAFEEGTCGADPRCDSQRTAAPGGAECSF